jgi:peptide/nickel transport system substrate-binding protein
MKAQSLDLASYPLYKENEAKGSYNLQLPPGFGGMIYAFNVTHTDPVLRKIFQDVRFKQAMSLAINREEINKLLYFGLAKPSQAVPSPKVSFIEPSMVEYMAQYDPTKANALLDEMGLKKGSDGIRLRPDGKPLSILMEYAQQAENVKNNELVKDYWEKVGMRVELKEVTTEALRANSRTNKQDIGVWSYTGYHEPFLIGNPQRLYPHWGDSTQAMAGLPWNQWYTTKGKEGEEPPADVKRLCELVDQWITTVPGSEQYVKLGKEMMKINLDNLYLIGTVGEIPGVTVISSKLGNVPQFTVQSSDFTRALPFRVDQWFFK